MCFAPQRRALFRHLNFQKWSENGVFCTFWLGHVLRATTACNFSSLIWPAGPAPAALARLLSTLRSHKSLDKRSESRLSYLFARLHLLSSLSFSSLIFSLLFFSSLTLPTSAFPSVHIVGSLTSKLPSIIPIQTRRCNRTMPKYAKIIQHHPLFWCIFVHCSSDFEIGRQWAGLIQWRLSGPTCEWLELSFWPFGYSTGQNPVLFVSCKINGGYYSPNSIVLQLWQVPKSIFRGNVFSKFPLWAIPFDSRSFSGVETQLFNGISGKLALLSNCHCAGIKHH